MFCFKCGAILFDPKQEISDRANSILEKVMKMASLLK